MICINHKKDQRTPLPSMYRNVRLRFRQGGHRRDCSQSSHRQLGSESVPMRQWRISKLNIHASAGSW
jgi:hypothetical protein